MNREPTPIWILTALSWTATYAAAAQDSKPLLDEEFRVLCQAYDKADKDFFAPYDGAKSDDEQLKIQLDFSKRPGVEYLPKFQRIALEARGKDLGLDATLRVLSLASTVTDPNLNPAPQAIDDLVNFYSDSPHLDKACRSVRQAANSNHRKAENALRVWTGSKHKNVQAAAMTSLADLLSGRGPKNSDNLDEARVLYECVKVTFKSLNDEYGRNYGKLAGAALFELNSLQSGMRAPEMTGTDQHGKPFKLSDLTGKVVVLDFWGFW